MLRTLNGVWLRAYARDLYAQGWSLAAIGEAMDPPRPRSTVRSWISSPLPSSPSSSSSSPITTAEDLHPPYPPPLPPPPSPLLRPSAPSHSSAPSPKPRAERRFFDPRSPDLSVTAARKIAHLAPLARRHRSRTAPTSPYALANDELTQICRAEYERGVSIRELAAAAGVTYKAMERRVRP